MPLLSDVVCSEADGKAADGNETALYAKFSQSPINREMNERTYEAVVIAADGVGAARAARADTDDGDRGAAKADDSGHILDDDAEEA